MRGVDAARADHRVGNALSSGLRLRSRNSSCTDSVDPAGVLSTDCALKDVGRWMHGYLEKGTHSPMAQGQST